jgi:hypothetical protein
VCTGRVERPLNAFSGQRLCRLGYVHELEDHRRFELRPQGLRVPCSTVNASGPGNGGPGGVRTHNLRVKSSLHCLLVLRVRRTRLSYWLMGCSFCAGHTGIVAGHTGIVNETVTR